MTDKFDLRKYLIENKVTANSKLLKEEDTSTSTLDLRNDPDTAQKVNDFIIEWMADHEHQYAKSTWGKGLDKLAKELGCSPQDLESVEAVDSYFGLETVLEIKFPEDMVELTEGNIYMFAHLMAPGRKIVFWSQDDVGTESDPMYWDEAAIVEQCIEPAKQTAGNMTESRKRQ